MAEFQPHSAESRQPCRAISAQERFSSDTRSCRHRRVEGYSVGPTTKCNHIAGTPNDSTAKHCYVAARHGYSGVGQAEPRRSADEPEGIIQSTLFVSGASRRPTKRGDAADDFFHYGTTCSPEGDWGFTQESASTAETLRTGFGWRCSAEPSAATKVEHGIGLRQLCWA